MQVKHQKVSIITDDGKSVEATAPIVISASRRTDIPAFYSKWFINRLRKGYCVLYNPFNQKPSYVSFKKTRVVVFWTKNPKPLIPFLCELEDRSIHYYFQFTLNDYEKENFEPNIPKIQERIETFKQLSEKIGKEKVIWRFDPLIQTKDVGIEELLRRVEYVGNQLKGYTEKLVFSFADIENYRKVADNLRREKIDYIDFNDRSMFQFAKALFVLNKNWKLKLATCAESIDLEQLEIEHNSCIDGELIKRIFYDDKDLLHFLTFGKTTTNDTLFPSDTPEKSINLKDPNQRKYCGCTISKDIGIYNTCLHFCKYCYANSSKELVRQNYKSHSQNNERM
ncbi:MAG: DUF1848 domain-containing protein [Salinivirgaceae bacterium]|jgi:DNA repair photolyase|nr:DUF1848 domain-containing protein [Bacteroidales bacterium]